MDVKDLNKSQLIILAILLSFITSIVTGITTVTLMEQAPSSVTVPINRVVRQTVEKIQQVEGKTTVQTVVVKEEDLVVDAISKNQSAVFSLTQEVLDDAGKTIEINVGRGFMVSNDGVLAVDGTLIPDAGTYYAKNESGKFKTTFIAKDKAGFSLLKIGAPLDEKNKLVISVPVAGDLSKMKIGQKVIVMGSNISSFIYEARDIKINVTKANAGGLVLNLNGEALGIALSGDNSFASIDSILIALKPKTP